MEQSPIALGAVQTQNKKMGPATKSGRLQAWSTLQTYVGIATFCVCTVSSAMGFCSAAPMLSFRTHTKQFFGCLSKHNMTTEAELNSSSKAGKELAIFLAPTAWVR